MTSKTKFLPYNQQTIRRAPQWNNFSTEMKHTIEVLSHVLPFRVNQYILDELIDWENIPNDPIYRLTFPHREMLREDEFSQLSDAIRTKKSTADIRTIVNNIRYRMNPHPAGQLTHNVPRLNGESTDGLQHKYKETVLFFPASGQTCHAYCTFCFRWPQFVGMDELKFEARTSDILVEYLKRHPEVTDVLITGGDPMIMSAKALRSYIHPLLIPELNHIKNIRIGTKSVAYWPQRYVSDKDSDDVLRLFEEIKATGKNLAIMAHYNHPNELQTEVAQTALKRIITTGATVRMQSPLIRHINDTPQSWASLWTTGVRLGAIPYYMFVERDTGPNEYFGMPLFKAWEIFQKAYQSVSGLARTVRGPSMSAFPGKVMIDGITEIAGEKVFALQFLQARNPDWVRRPFYAKFDSQASWLDDLKPAFGQSYFFYEESTQNIRQENKIKIIAA
ncbi:KamA family radical SAM protein [Vibrio quintilis]|uniref:L-lysine 2,3-aminomutase n=1 Tax=Vibrio quintilis TaxID=1117707 RepID=A0A1M7YZA5_9VIBR|nr:lysine 2,3-aminomutase [Vibrio quintilis]SHO57924.1 L-lysine 2,3-aminomutase [Vibrio quintilis]